MFTLKNGTFHFSLTCYVYLSSSLKKKIKFGTLFWKRRKTRSPISTATPVFALLVKQAVAGLVKRSGLHAWAVRKPDQGGPSPLSEVPLPVPLNFSIITT